jgi:hypothetical protein
MCPRFAAYLQATESETLATENTEGTETVEKVDLTEQILAAAIDVPKFGCFPLVEEIDRISP